MRIFTLFITCARAARRMGGNICIVSAAGAKLLQHSVHGGVFKRSNLIRVRNLTCGRNMQFVLIFFPTPFEIFHSVRDDCFPPLRYQWLKVSKSVRSVCTCAVVWFVIAIFSTSSVGIDTICSCYCKWRPRVNDISAARHVVNNFGNFDSATL